MNATRIVRWILPALLMTFVSAIGPASAHAQIAITVTTAPPALPVYEQPPCPQEGWMWSPGYWAWGDDDGYYWVPGEWVPAPYTGALWTPPWWGWESGRYRFHDGYWGNDVGYYGGIDYGYGYMGEGFSGGEWRDGRFAYNTAVMRVDRTVVRNVYVNETIVQQRTISNDRRISYNGGPGGIRHDPTPIERRGMTGRHTTMTSLQQQQIQAARADRASYAKANNGHPRTLVAARPAGPARNEAPTTRNDVRPGGQPGQKGVRPTREEARPGSEGQRTAPTRSETRPAPARNAPETRTEPKRRLESKPAATEAPRSESRATPALSSPERHSAPRSAGPTEKPRAEPRANPLSERPRTESRPAPQTERSRPEPHPTPQAREQRPTTIQRESAPHESRPAPPQRESRPAPASHAAPQHESRPAEPHASVNRPAPPQRETRRAESHPAAAHPNAHPAGGEKQGKPRSE